MISATYCCVPEGIRPIFDVALELTSKRLGIDAYNATIKFHLRPPGFTSKDTPEGMSEGGALAPSLSEENAKRVEKGLPPKLFDLSITVDSPTQMMLAFAHEMIHIRQWLTGELAIKTMRKSSPKELQYLYYNRVPIKDEIPYKARPWETEAHKKMDELAVWLMRELTKHEEEILGKVRP